MLQQLPIQRFVTQRHDLPVFLNNPDGQAPLADARPSDESDLKNTLSPFSAGTLTQLEPHYLAAKNSFNSLRERGRAWHPLWRQQNVKEMGARIGLMALVIPLAMLATPERARLPVKPVPIAQKVVPPPVFEPDQRLAFAQGLRERLLANAIASSLQIPTPSKAESEVYNSPTERRRLDTPTAVNDLPATSADAPVPQVATSNETWSLPFGGQTYAPPELPHTPSDSFRSEVAISDWAASKTTVPNVAENAALVPQAKLHRAEKKRTRAIAQKRRPQRGNQMTASAAAQPPVARQEPNLPPPPILFFLGAPPPQSQPAQ